jgi:1-deoxy-D-xylulose-5-phosphate reductoisomerase
MNAACQRQRITVLGATGSIGMSTLDVVARHRDRFEVFAMSGHRQLDRLLELCIRFAPRIAVTADAAGATSLRADLRAAGCATEVLSGPQALIDIANHAEVDCVMAAIVGAAGLQPTLAAAAAGKRLLLANKEALVMAGELFMAEVRRGGALLLPIDSEHNAVFQSLPHGYSGDIARSGVRRIILTASGGPFRQMPLGALAHVTPEQACAHPNWVMGRKISVDSATMMNKGLEVIEAHWLFNVAAEEVEVVIHPQSVIHSLVDYVDGSVLAQLGNPDMRTPIAHALAWPERLDAGVRSLDLFEVAQLSFERPDSLRFPCLELAYRALRAGGTASTVLNAANEEAVSAFLDRRLGFTRIADVISASLDSIASTAARTLGDVLEADARTRSVSRSLISRWMEEMV